MTIQFVSWPLLLAFLSLVASTFRDGVFGHPERALVIWGCAFAAQIAVLVYNFATYEIYNHVRYVETRLRPKLAALIGTNSFWGYERFLSKTGKANDPLFGDVGPLLVSLGAIGLASVAQWDCWSQWDLLGLSWNGLVFIGAVAMSLRVIAARKGFLDAVAA
jgi:hypothetical protein